MDDERQRLIAGASEKPSDCLRAVAKIWEEERQPASREELAGWGVLVEIAYRQLDKFRFHLANVAGSQGIHVDGPPFVGEVPEPPPGTGR